MIFEFISLKIAVCFIALAAYYDLCHSQNIPNNILYGFLIFTTIAAFDIVNIVFGFLIFAGCLFISKITKNEFGEADCYILAGIGMILPYNFVWIAFLASCSAAVQMMLQKKKRPIAFVPHILLGLILNLI